MLGSGFRNIIVAALFSGAIAACPSPVVSTEAYDPWPGLVQDVFNNRPMNDGTDVIGIEMPYRAEDAAIVPVTLRNRLAPSDSRRVVATRRAMPSGTNGRPMPPEFERASAPPRST